MERWFNGKKLTATSGPSDRPHLTLEDRVVLNQVRYESAVCAELPWSLATVSLTHTTLKLRWPGLGLLKRLPLYLLAGMCGSVVGTAWYASTAIRSLQLRLPANSTLRNWIEGRNNVPKMNEDGELSDQGAATLGSVQDAHNRDGMNLSPFAKRDLELSFRDVIETGHGELSSLADDLEYSEADDMCEDSETSHIFSYQQLRDKIRAAKVKREDGFTLRNLAESVDMAQESIRKLRHKYDECFFPDD